MPNRILSNAALFRVVVFISFAWLVSACGGGGGGSRTPDDTTPTAFSFTAQSDAELNEGFESESVEISGINTEAPVSIVGGEYSIDGDDFTNSAGSITNGQSIIVSLEASDEFETTTEAVLTVGEVSVSFEVTTFAEDSTPAEFSFTAQTDVELTEEITSNSITVTDINTSATVSIEGGEYSIDGGEFTAAAGSITEGQTIVVNLAPSVEFETSSEATLTVGDVTGIFEITTRAADVEPAAFTFTDVDEVDFATEVESNEVSITGIEIPVAISIADGEYSIAGGDFTAEAGTVESGQAVQVRGTSGVIPSSTVDVTLTVGPVSDTFTITAIADTTAPEAAIVFPPINSKTDGDTILVRGTASDDLSVISSVSVLGVEATSDDGFATWEVSVPLTLGLNSLDVVIGDAAGNVSNIADTANITYDPDRGPFSDEFFNINSPTEVVLDPSRSRLIGNGITSIISVDIETGSPSVLIDSSLLDPDDGISLLVPNALLVREDVLWVYGRGSVFTVNLVSSDITLISSNVFPNDEVAFLGTFGDMVFDPNNDDRLLIAQDNRVISVNMVSGEREVLFESDLSGAQFSTLAYDRNSDQFFTTYLRSIDGIENGLFRLDFDNQLVIPFSTISTHPEAPGFSSINTILPLFEQNSILVSNVEVDTLGVFNVSLSDGARSVFSGPNTPNDFNGLRTGYRDIFYSPELEFFYSVGITSSASGFALPEIHAVDIKNGNRVIVARWLAPDT